MTRFRSRAMLTALIAAAMLTGTAAARVTYRRFHIVQEIRAVDAEIGTLKREKEELERTRDTLNDFATIEKAARELLSLRREGENVVVLLPTGEEPLPPGDEGVAAPPEPGNLVKWWGYFFADSASER